MSCVGARDMQRKGPGTYLPHDFRYEGEDSIAKNGIGQDRFQTWFAQIPARISVLLYDTCESGSLTGDRVQQRGIERVAALDRLTRAMGRTVLSASTDDAPALEGYKGHGVFSYVALDALGQADTKGDGLIDVTELAGYIDRMVPEVNYSAFKMRHLPQMKIVGSNYPLVTRTAALSPGETLVAIPAKPTHVVIAQTPVRSLARGSDTIVELSPGTQVTLVETADG